MLSSLNFKSHRKPIFIFLDCDTSFMKARRQKLNNKTKTLRQQLSRISEGSEGFPTPSTHHRNEESFGEEHAV